MNGIILTITGFIMKSISMIFSLYVSNKIGPEALGVFNLVMAVYLFAITLATSGFSIACTYLVSEQFEKGNYLNGLKAVKSCIKFSLFFGLIVSIIVILFSDIISKYWLKSMISNTPLYLISIGLPFICISSSINGYFSAVRKAYKNAISQAIELIIKILISILLLNFSTNKNLESICIYLILADVISEVFSCCLLVILYKMEKLKLVRNTDKKINFKKEIFKITFPISVTSYLRSGLSTLKQFLIPARLVLFGLPYSIALSEYRKN